MVRPDYRNFRNSRFFVGCAPILEHSAKGSTWEDHKYIKRIDGTYYYPDNYEGGRHLPDDVESEENNRDIDELTDVDIENLAKEVVRGNFGNGQERKDLLGIYYDKIQKRVNEIMKTSAGSKKVFEASESSVKKAEEIAKKVSTSSTSVTKSIDINQVLSVYNKKK